jgi:hypothetical protein
MLQLASLVPREQDRQTKGVGVSLAAATTLRAIMKNHPEIRHNVFEVLREQAASLGVVIDDEAWVDLLIASAGDLEHSKAHVIE